MCCHLSSNFPYFFCEKPGSVIFYLGQCWLFGHFPDTLKWHKPVGLGFDQLNIIFYTVLTLFLFSCLFLLLFVLLLTAFQGPPWIWCLSFALTPFQIIGTRELKLKSEQSLERLAVFSVIQNDYFRVEIERACRAGGVVFSFKSQPNLAEGKSNTNRQAGYGPYDRRRIVANRFKRLASSVDEPKHWKFLKWWMLSSPW